MDSPKSIAIPLDGLDSLSLTHSLAHTHTHTQRYSRTLACAANFRKLTKLFSLLGFAGWIPMLIYEDCKLVRCFRTVHHPPTRCWPTLYVCYIHTYSTSKYLCVCLFGYLFQASPLSPSLSLSCFLQPDNIDYAVFFACFISRSCCRCRAACCCCCSYCFLFAIYIKLNYCLCL